MKALLLLVLCSLFASPLVAAEKKKLGADAGDPEVKSTVWVGEITSISATSVKVTDAKSKSKTFQIYPGTIFGRGGSATLAEFKKGDRVTVNFSEVPGSNILRAENISPPRVKKN